MRSPFSKIVLLFETSILSYQGFCSGGKKEYSLTRTQHEERCDNRVGEKSEQAVSHVSGRTEASSDNLEKGLGTRGADLQLDGDEREEEELDRGPGGVPERAADAELQQRSFHSKWS